MIIFSLLDQKVCIHTGKERPWAAMASWKYLQHVGHCLKSCKEEKRKKLESSYVYPNSQQLDFKYFQRDQRSIIKPLCGWSGNPAGAVTAKFNN